MSGEARSGSDGSYGTEVGMSSVSWIIESNCGTQYIQGGGMVPGNQKTRNPISGNL